MLLRHRSFAPSITERPTRQSDGGAIDNLLKASFCLAGNALSQVCSTDGNLDDEKLQGCHIGCGKGHHINDGLTLIESDVMKGKVLIHVTGEQLIGHKRPRGRNDMQKKRRARGSGTYYKKRSQPKRSPKRNSGLNPHAQLALLSAMASTSRQSDNVSVVQPVVQKGLYGSGLGSTSLYEAIKANDKKRVESIIEGFLPRRDAFDFAIAFADVFRRYPLDYALYLESFLDNGLDVNRELLIRIEMGSLKLKFIGPVWTMICDESVPKEVHDGVRLLIGDRIQGSMSESGYIYRCPNSKELQKVKNAIKARDKAKVESLIAHEKGKDHLGDWLRELLRAYPDKFDLYLDPLLNNGLDVNKPTFHGPPWKALLSSLVPLETFYKVFARLENLINDEAEPIKHRGSNSLYDVKVQYINKSIVSPMGTASSSEQTFTETFF